MFLVNSRLGLVTATTQKAGREVLFLKWHPFSRSYGANLPSSFTWILSSALGFSPRLRVSVYGTVTASTPPRGFSRQYAPLPFAGPEGPFGIGARLSERICLSGNAYHLTSGRPSPDGCFAPASPLGVITRCIRYGNINPFPIAYALRPRLRDRLTRSG